MNTVGGHNSKTQISKGRRHRVGERKMPQSITWPQLAKKGWNMNSDYRVCSPLFVSLSRFICLCLSLSPFLSPHHPSACASMFPFSFMSVYFIYINIKCRFFCLAWYFYSSRFYYLILVFPLSLFNPFLSFCLCVSGSVFVSSNPVFDVLH